jgi:hypothetical protein
MNALCARGGGAARMKFIRLSAHYPKADALTNRDIELYKKMN